MKRNIFATLLVVLFTLGFASGCAQEEPVVTDTVASEPVVEEAGEQVEEAVEQVEESADEMEDSTDGMAEEAAEGVEEAADAAEDQI